MDCELLVKNLCEFQRYLMSDLDNFPRKVNEGMKLFFNYRAAYIIYRLDKNGIYSPIEYYGTQVYKNDFTVFATRYAQQDVFVKNISNMISFKNEDEKYVWRVQDFQPLSQFESSEYYKKGLYPYGVGYRVWITFQQAWNKAQHTVVVFKTLESGDFSAEELKLLKWIGMTLRLVMNSYLDSITVSQMISAMASESYYRTGKSAIIDCQLRVLFKDEGFNQLSSAVLGETSLWCAIHDTCDNFDPMSVRVGKKYHLFKRLGNQEYIVEIWPYWQATDFTHTMQFVYAVNIRPQGTHEPPPEGKAMSPPDKAGGLVIDAVSGSGELESLTRRELEILRRLYSGESTGQMAERMYISVTTVRTHMSNVFKKLGVHNRTEAITRIIELSKDR